MRHLLSGSDDGFDVSGHRCSGGRGARSSHICRDGPGSDGTSPAPTCRTLVRATAEGPMSRPWLARVLGGVLIAAAVSGPGAAEAALGRPERARRSRSRSSRQPNAARTSCRQGPCEVRRAQSRDRAEGAPVGRLGRQHHRLRFDEGVKLAIVQSDVYQAFVGPGERMATTGGRTDPAVAVIVPLYNEEIYFIVRADSPLAVCARHPRRGDQRGPAGSGTAMTATRSTGLIPTPLP